MVYIIRIYFLSKSRLNESAAKYFILNLNKVQDCFEYQFIDMDYYPIKDKVNYKSDDLFMKFNSVIKNENKRIINKGFPLEKVNMHIGILDVGIDNNLYFMSDPLNKKALITIKDWQKIFYPPTVFEYLVQCIIQSTFYILCEDSSVNLCSHFETKGCMFDYTYNKLDKKADMVLGFICDKCKKLISKTDKKYLDCINKMMAINWIGDLGEFNSVAYNLKKAYRIDVNKDTGLEKTKWEKFWDYISDVFKPVISYILILLIGVLIGYIIRK